MAVAFAVLAGAVVLGIAFFALGKVTGELSDRPAKSVFDMDEAVDFVADRLPFELAARLSHDDVRQVLNWHLDFLESKGVASESVPDVLTSGNGDGPVLVGDDDGVAFVIGRASKAGLDLSDLDVVLIIESEQDYLRAIGAVGGEVAAPDEPD